MRLLTRREHSRRELLEKLQLRGHDCVVAEAVLDELAEQGWQSDRRYAESYARQRISKGYGPLRIVYEIEQRGGERIDVDAVMQETGGDWQEALKKIYVEKYGLTKDLSYTEWAKRVRFLQHRGFSQAMIKALFVNLGLKFAP